MCGFVGFWEQGIHSKSPLQILKQMSDVIIHRGPDAGLQWFDPDAGIGLAHRRLSIVDLSDAGAQPMQSIDGRYVIVFNGEVYNFNEIRKELECAKFVLSWRGHSDTEVMLAAISAWGIEEALSKFTGMFAFALWDKADRQLTLARDRFGEKPLYYGWVDNTLVFGSELKGLKKHPAFKTVAIDRDALHLYIRHNNINAPHTIYKNIYKLSPASYIQFGHDECRVNSKASAKIYWSLSEAINIGKKGVSLLDANQAKQGLDSLLRKVISDQMVADVPLGAFLSGGVDSSTIVALMQAQSNRPIKTFTIGFHEDAYNEAEHAKAVAKHLGTDHTEWYITPKEILDVIPNLPALYDEPFADSSQIPTYLVSQMTRKHVTVSLSGDAGDELFGGYNRYFQAEKIWNKLNYIPVSMRKMLQDCIVSCSPSSLDALGKVASILSLGKLKHKNIGDKLHKLSGLFAFENKIDIYKYLISQWDNPSLILSQGKEPLTLLDMPEKWPENITFTELMMYLDTLIYLPGDILTKVDRAAMGVSLETRVPFLDHNVAEFAWKLPLNMKIRDGKGKWLLRQVLYDYVPQSLIERPKQGFGLPIDTWLRTSLKDWASDLLDPVKLRQQGYFNADVISRFWSEHLSGKRNWQHKIWTILMFQAWLEKQDF